jgi:hypothetical protein
MAKTRHSGRMFEGETARKRPKCDRIRISATGFQLEYKVLVSDWVAIAANHCVGLKRPDNELTRMVEPLWGLPSCRDSRALAARALAARAPTKRPYRAWRKGRIRPGSAF